MSSSSTTDGSLFCYENLPPEKPIDDIPPGTTRYICERATGKIKPLRRARLRPIFFRCKRGAKLTEYISSYEDDEVNKALVPKTPTQPVEVIDLDGESDEEGGLKETAGGSSKKSVAESQSKEKGVASGSGKGEVVGSGSRKGKAVKEKQQKKGSLSGMKRVRSGLPIDPDQLADEDYMDFLRDVHPEWFADN